MSFTVYGKEFLLTNAVTELTLGLGTNEALLIASATATNTDTSVRTLSVNFASGGAAAATGNLIEDARTLPINTATNTALSGKSLKPGGKVYAGADVTNVVVLSITGTIVPQTA